MSLDFYLPQNFAISEVACSIDPLLLFCRKNYFNFTSSILQRLPKTFESDYVDLRSTDFPNYFDVSIELFRKQIGILLKHQLSHTKIRYEIVAKKSHEEIYKEYLEPPQFPKDELPPLLELLDRQDHPEHDELRFKLLKWMVDERKLKDCDLSTIPTNYFLDILVLVWMTGNGFITTTEADLVLLTVKRVELKNIPKNYEAPQHIDRRAFCIAIFFTKFHEVLKRSLEVIGLKRSMTVS